VFISLAKELRTIIYVLLLALIIGYHIKGFTGPGFQLNSYLTLAIISVLVLMGQHFLKTAIERLEH
jgi:hypothetical protein